MNLNPFTGNEDADFIMILIVSFIVFETGMMIHFIS